MGARINRVAATARTTTRWDIRLHVLAAMDKKAFPKVFNWPPGAGLAEGARLFTEGRLGRRVSPARARKPAQQLKTVAKARRNVRPAPAAGKGKGPKRVYAFEEGDITMKAILGSKGAGLAEMSSIGLPVPPGFTITAQACIEYQKLGKMPPGLMEDVGRALTALEGKAKATLSDPANPLLVSVRSGAAISMPGMMDTVLNLGLNDQTVEGVAKATKNPRFAYDSYRRFLTMFGNVVLGLEHKGFEHKLKALKARLGVDED